MTDETTEITFEEIQQQLARAQMATRINVILVIVMSIVASLAFASTGKTPDNYLWATIAAIMAVSALIGAILSRAGRSDLGMGLTLGVFLTLILPVAFLAKGIGLLLFLAAIVLTAIVAQSTLSAYLTRFALISGATVGVIALLIDLFGPPIQRITPDPVVSNVMLVALIIALTAFLIRNFASFSLRMKLIGSFLAVAVLTATIMTLMVQNLTTRSLTERVGNELNLTAKSRSLAVGDQLAKQVDTLKTLATNEMLEISVESTNWRYKGDETEVQKEIDQLDQQWRAADAADDDFNPLVWSRMHNTTARQLLRYQETFPENAEVFITDVKGGLVATTNRTSDYNQADEEWWQKAYNEGKGDTYISPPEFDASVGQLSILMALPVRNRNTSQIVGVLRTTVLLTNLDEILAVQTGETGNSALVIPGEPVQYYHDGEYTEMESALADQLNKAQGKPYSEISIDEILRMASLATLVSTYKIPAIDNLGWQIIVHQQKDEALAPVEATTRYLVILLIVVAVIATAVAAGLSQYLAAPIVKLTIAARSLAAGDLSVEAPVTSKDEIGTLAFTFNAMTAQLRELIGTLEQRVAARTRQIETSAQVSRRLSTILDIDQLVKEVVDQLQTAFNYYHAHIYLYDEAQENLVMMGGTGEAGRVMLARGHQIPKGRGLVGRAAETNAPVLVTDTSQDPNWLPNPLLPETKSELAVPIAIADRVLGVLDVQQNVVAGLTEEDVVLIESIASQVAVGVQNARAYTEIQRRAERETLLRNISQKIQIATTVDDVLKIALRELGQATGTQRASVALSATNLAKDGQN